MTAAQFSWSGGDDREKAMIGQRAGGRDRGSVENIAVAGQADTGAVLGKKSRGGERSEGTASHIPDLELARGGQKKKKIAADQETVDTRADFFAGLDRQEAGWGTVI